jgi:hypothetical protein
MTNQDNGTTGAPVGVKTEPRLDPLFGGADTARPDPGVTVIRPGNPLPKPAAGAPSMEKTVTEAPAVESAPRLDQLSRVEDKTARIEEKFARSEERMMRVESALEKATLRLEGATQDMNLQGVRDDIARLRDQVGRKPGGAAIFAIALVAALIGAAIPILFARFGSLLPF